jgi:hypothetical protein
MSGIKIKLGKGTTITRDGKIKIVPIYRDASAAIRAKKSKKQRVIRRQAT